MCALTARQVRTIERLLTAQGPLTLVRLAAELGVSTRTLQRDLPELEAWLAAQGIGLEARARVGLILDGTAELRRRALERLRSLHPSEPMPAQERQRLLLQELLLSPEGAKLAYFSHRFGVTEATISHDLDRLEPWLEVRGLTLIRRPGFGIQLQGSERQIRAAIVEVLRRDLTEEQLYELLRRVTRQGEDGEATAVTDQLLHFVDEATVVALEAAVRELDSAGGLGLTESAIAGLVVHLALAVERLRRGEEIRFPEETLAQLRRTREWQRAKELVRTVEQRLALAVPEDEVGSITMHLRGARIRVDASAELDPERREAMELARAMASAAEQALGAPLTQAPGLIHGLAVHLAPAINRLRLGMEIRNPLLEQVREEYPELFAVGQQVCKLLAGHLGCAVPDAEVGFIAMHLGAALERLRSQVRFRFSAVLVCPSGMGSSQLLAGRLAYAIPELAVQDVVSSLDLPGYIQGLNRPPDIILSTVSLAVPEVPVVVVSPLLPSADVSRVREALRALAGPGEAWQGEPPQREAESALPRRGADPAEVARRAAAMGPVVLHLLEHFRLAPLKGEDVVTAACALLGQTSLPHDAALVAEALRRREALGSTQVGDGLQLLHARTEGIGGAFVGLLRTAERTVLVMLAPQEAAPEVLEALGTISVALVEDEAFVRALRSQPEEALRTAIGGLLQPLMFTGLQE